MKPDEIAATYEVLAPTATDYANANLERVGQAQASYGPLAQAAMGDSQTAGIGNYTYNRLARPTVDTMRDQLIVEGYSAALNKQLSDSLNEAKKNYNRAARNYSPSKTTNPSGNKSGDDFIENEYLDDGGDTGQDDGKLMLTPSEAYAHTRGHYKTMPTKEMLEKEFGRKMSDAQYTVYTLLWEGRNKEAQEYSQQLLQGAE